MYPKGFSNKISEIKVVGAPTLYANADLIIITGNPSGAILSNIIAPPGARADYLIYLLNISGDGYFIDNDGIPSNISEPADGFNLATNRPFGLIYNKRDSLWYPIY